MLKEFSTKTLLENSLVSPVASVTLTVTRYQYLSFAEGNLTAKDPSDSSLTSPSAIIFPHESTIYVTSAASRGCPL